MARLKRRDTRQRLELLDLHQVELRQIHPGLDRNCCLRELHVVTPQGTVRQGFAAFRHLFRQLPSTAWWAIALYVPPVPLVGNLVYRWVAHRRYGRAHSCATGQCTTHQ